MSRTIIIIGAGQGGFQAAASLRQEGFDGRILLCGDEPGLPYQRPPLSKAYMKEGDAARLALRPETFYGDNNIELRAGVRITAIDRDAREVVSEDGSREPYDHLILATGAVNLRPPIAGIDGPGLLELRDLTDAAALRARLPGVRHALVIGGGFIGLEFAAVARGAGADVTVVEAAPRLMARVASAPLSERVARMHEAMSTRILCGQAVTGIIRSDGGAAAGVTLADGTEIHADLVLLAAGVRPATALAEAAGLELDNGIAVNARLRTSDPDISALGDCASFPDALSGRRLRLESVQAATDQARCLARNLTGKPEDYSALPWFWSDQGSWKLQMAGLGAEGDETILHEGANGALTFLRYLGDRLICVETVNAAADHMAARRLLALSRPVTRSDIDAAGGSPAALLKSRSQTAA